MDLEIFTLSKLERERQIPYDITYMWNLKYHRNDLYKTEIVSHRKELMVTKGKRERN